MATDTINNFISPTSTVLTWAKAQIDTLATAGTLANTTEIYESQDPQLIFNWIHQATRNQAVIKYVSSTYNRDGTSRRSLKFDVYVVYRYTTNRVSGQSSAVTLMDSVIGVLDHEGTADFICYVIADGSVDFPNAGLSVYMASFVVEDY